MYYAGQTRPEGYQQSQLQAENLIMVNQGRRAPIRPVMCYKCDELRHYSCDCIYIHDK